MAAPRLSYASAALGLRADGARALSLACRGQPLGGGRARKRAPAKEPAGACVWRASCAAANLLRANGSRRGYDFIWPAPPPKSAQGGRPQRLPFVVARAQRAPGGRRLLGVAAGKGRAHLLAAARAHQGRLAYCTRACDTAEGPRPAPKTISAPNR